MPNKMELQLTPYAIPKAPSILWATKPTSKNHKNIPVSSSQLLMDWVSVWVTINTNTIAAKAKNMVQKGSLFNRATNFCMVNRIDSSNLRSIYTYHIKQVGIIYYALLEIVQIEK